MTTEIEIGEETMLSKYVKLTAIDVYDKGRVPEIIGAIEREALSFALTPESGKGREEIASLAYKVARSKMYLDNLGKDRVAEWKEKAKVVDADRKLIRDRLDDLKDQIRQPLTEWEEREKARNQAIIEKLDLIRAATTRGFDMEQGLAGYPTPEEMDSRIEKLDLINLDFFQEFREQAQVAITDAIVKLQAAIIARKTYDEQQAELAALKQAEEDRKAREAKERAEAEEKARQEREAARAKEREAQIREEERKRAQAAQDAAVKAERERLAQKKLKEEEAQRKREANQRHRMKIIAEAREDLLLIGYEADVVEAFIAFIAEGKVRNITINF